MALGDFNYDPVTGWNDVDQFPDYPAREQVRPLLQKLYDQIKVYLGLVKTEITAHVADSTLAHGINLKANKTQEAWITATLLNGWTGTLKYAKNDLNILTLVADITTGTITDLTVIISALPVGYRPLYAVPIKLIRYSTGEQIPGLFVRKQGDIQVCPSNNLIAATRYEFSISYSVNP